MFFDIECADGNTICSLGYVLCDGEFNILDKKDLLINPQCAFRLGRAGFDPYIKLSYTRNQFRKSPTFAERYAQIKSLLTKPGRVLLGHSISSDLKFLEYACERSNLPQFDLRVYDTQKMYAEFTCEKQPKSLEKIVTELGLDVSHLTEHKSCDDAEMTMLVLRGICARRALSVEELLAQSRGCIVDRAQMAEVHRLSVIRKTVKNMKRFYPESKDAPAVYFDQSVREREQEGRLGLIKVLHKKGFCYALEPDDAKYIVTDGKNAPETQKKPDAAIITVSELSGMLGVKVNEYGEVSPVK